MSTNSDGRRTTPKPLSVDEAGIDHVQALAVEIRRRQGERIREARKLMRSTIDDIAAKTGLHFNTVGRIERGENEATLEQLIKIANALHVSPASLSAFPAQSDGFDSEEFAVVDMLDVRVSGGAGAVNGHLDVVGRFAFNRHWLNKKGLKPQHAKIVRVAGDSMADRINDGDILLVNTAVTAFVGEAIYLIELDGMDYVKFLQRDFATGGLQIISFNPKWKPQLLSPEAAASLRITGLVAWSAGEL